MTYRGRVRNGVVILDDPVSLPEGAEVWVDLRTVLADGGPTKPREPTLGEKLLKYAGCITDLPPDSARNLDHYLYGTPKK